MTPPVAVDASYLELEGELAAAKASAIRSALEHLAGLEPMGLAPGTEQAMRELAARLRSEANELERMVRP